MMFGNTHRKTMGGRIQPCHTPTAGLTGDVDHDLCRKHTVVACIFRRFDDTRTSGTPRPLMLLQIAARMQHRSLCLRSQPVHSRLRSMARREMEIESTVYCETLAQEVPTA